jgi:hypothetical protein
MVHINSRFSRKTRESPERLDRCYTGVRNNARCCGICDRNKLLTRLFLAHYEVIEKLIVAFVASPAKPSRSAEKRYAAYDAS